MLKFNLTKNTSVGGEDRANVGDHDDLRPAPNSWNIEGRRSETRAFCLPVCALCNVDVHVPSPLFPG